MLVRKGASISRIPAARSTSQRDWSHIETVLFATSVQRSSPVEATRRSGGFVLTADPPAGKACSTVSLYSQAQR